MFSRSVEGTSALDVGVRRNLGKMMDSGRGKSITTSVPSMAIRFNATAEEIEEVYDASEEEQNDGVAEVTLSTKSNELESSPRRLILPLLGKRATSIDINTSSTTQDASPPSDPWRFLSDIKGKITKSVEGRLTEYKARSHDGDGSPKLTNVIKDSKENSSLSDSEEVSESSISKTCGIASTTEGVEMSSDDEETPSLSEKDKLEYEAGTHLMHSSSNPNLRQRFKIANSKNTMIKEGSVDMEFLEGIQKINDSLAGADSEIESGIDVLADINISNFRVDDDNVLNVTQVSGIELRENLLSSELEGKTVFSPIGFVDLRVPPKAATWFDVVHSFRHVIFALMTLILYITLPLTVYFSGFITGALVMFILSTAYIKFFLSNVQPKSGTHFPLVMPLLQFPAVKEHLPLKKYEGWVNEYPEKYNPHTYHVSQTQSVYLRLQGNFLRISHGRQRIPKRAMWNEPEHKLVFTNHRVYNLRGAKVSLLPQGLAKVRHWSKKYPICITLSADQINYELPAQRGGSVKNSENRRKELEKAQVFSKLVCEDEEPTPSAVVDTIIVASASTDASAGGSGTIIKEASAESKVMDAEEEDEDEFSLASWHDITHTESSSDITHLYIFTRTARDKEEWFRRFRMATYNESGMDPEQPCDQDKDANLEAYRPQSQSSMLEEEYLKFMNKLSDFIVSSDELTETEHTRSRVEYKEDIGAKPFKGENESHWINAFMGRVMFDSLREEWLLQRIKDRLQRKLASIKLPYFIQELYCEELKLGNTAPYITRTHKPILNNRGLWFDLDVTYEGLFVMTLQTKLDLMKLKQPHLSEEKIQRNKEKSAIFHSDVDDTAESSTDDEHGGHRVTSHSHTTLDSGGQPVTGLGGTSTKTKKLMKMVDRITESKFFQAASEMKYIKKAMEGVSNTDIRLKVEVKKCVGTVVMNIPPPPTDRVWLGFKYPPELTISAYPIVGERNINLNQLMSWIEKKIYNEFQKILVLPNMEDFSIPVMCSKLPE